MANANQIGDWLKNCVEKYTKNVVNSMTEYATKQAQNNYNKFEIEVGADDPYVSVFNTPLSQTGKNTYNRMITCYGNQVIFIEFGAGVYYYTETETRLYSNILNHRPRGVDEIGHYHNAKWGRSRGQDDLWFYKSRTGRESENAHLYKFNKSGDPIMITHGNRPARALYRAVGMAFRKVKGGKLK